jgi:putative MATE family efflux protein
VDRQVAALAVPALGALLAEPVFLLTDAAIIGRTGAVPLAGLAAGSAVLATAVGLFVVLAYATTATVARRLGAGDLRGALAQGVDGAWLGLASGVVVGAAGWLAAPWLVEALGAPDAARPGAVSYLRWSLPGLPGMLLVLAATGVLRGLQDTRTPLVVAVAAAAANLVADLVLVLGAGLGLAGAGAGTALAQTGAGTALAVVVVRGARRHGASLAPRWDGVRRASAASAPLLVRTAGLRAALLLTAAVAAGQGVAALAGHHVVLQLWSLLALALDAVAIAAQTLVGRALGAGDAVAAREVLRAVTRSGVGAGAVLGAVVLAAAPWLPRAFTGDPATAAAISAALVVVAVAQPLAGWVFVLDGVLVGAGDGRYLAVASLVTLAAYAPLAWGVREAALGGTAGLVALWVAFAGAFMAARAATLGLRVRGEQWLVVGAVR